MKRISTFMIIFMAFFITAIIGANDASSGAFRQEGIASWYGNEFHGRPTASGEIFDSSQLTAAHPTLPFGTVLTVTNTFNNKQVTVTVNDRGPFVSARIIDLSRGAAEILDMIHTGTARVIVENAAALQTTAAVAAEAPVLQEVPQQTQQTALAAAAIPASINIIGGIPGPGNGKFYRLQIGAYRIPRNAVDAFEKLSNAGLDPKYERLNDFYRVVITGLRSEEIPSVAEKIRAAGFTEAIIREES